MSILRELQHNYRPFVLDIVQPSIWLLLLIVIFVPPERLFAISPQKVFRKSWPTHLAYYFLNGLVVKTLLVFPGKNPTLCHNDVGSFTAHCETVRHTAHVL